MRVRQADAGEVGPSPRELARLERERLLRRALNEAAVRPSSEVILVEPDEGESLTAIRLSLQRLLEDEPRDLVWGVRDGRIVIAKGELPPVARGPHKRPSARRRTS
jgi:hypothetical protein